MLDAFPLDLSAALLGVLFVAIMSAFAPCDPGEYGC